MTKKNTKRGSLRAGYDKVEKSAKKRETGVEETRAKHRGGTLYTLAELISYGIPMGTAAKLLGKGSKVIGGYLKKNRIKREAQKLAKPKQPTKKVTAKERIRREDMQKSMEGMGDPAHISPQQYKRMTATREAANKQKLLDEALRGVGDKAHITKPQLSKFKADAVEARKQKAYANMDDPSHITKPQYARIDARANLGMKHGGKITYRMSGGQVVAAGYD